MIRTEEEAKKKWCPFARTGYGLNRDFPEHDEDPPKLMAVHNCIASQCMAWRWTGAVDGTDASMPGLGFCGLAGDGEVK